MSEVTAHRAWHGKIHLIQMAVAEAFDSTTIDMVSSRRDAKTVLARHSAIWLTRKLTKSSRRAIGSVFGGRDPATIFNAQQNIEYKMRDDRAFNEKVTGLLKRLGTI